jgi:hypothetical protein
LEIKYVISLGKKKKKSQLASDQRAGVGAFGNKICHFVGKKKKKSQLASDQKVGVGAFGNKICHFVGKKKEKKSVGVGPDGQLFRYL